jgi:hypothetical protein
MQLSAFYPGTWCRRPGGLSYQDILILDRAR